MNLIRLVYASTVSEPLKHSDIEQIIHAAQTHNVEQGITGMLYFNNNYFLQCLEGDREKVNALYNSIVKDARHHNVVILSYQEISSRDFQNWSMGYIPISCATKPLALKFSSNHEFDPYRITGHSAYLLLLEMKKNLPTAW